MTENILIEFTSDASGLNTGVTALENMGKVDSNLANTFHKTNASLKEREKVVGAASNALSGFTKSLKNADKATTGAFGKKALEDFKKVVGDSNTAIKLLDNTLKGAKAKLDQLKQSGKENTDEWKKLKQQIADGEQMLKLFAEEAQQTEAKTKSLRSQLRELKQEMALMEDQGKEDTVEFRNMAIAAARLEDQLGDTQARIRAMASDTANIDAVATGLQTLAAGGQIAAGASALLGEENEDLQKTLVQLNAIMAITAGIREVINNLQKQSILRLKLEAAGQAILATSTRLTAGTFSLLGISVNATSTAFKGLRAAMISTGIGALVVAIGFLVAKVIELSEATDDAAEKQKELNEQFSKFREDVERLDELDRLDKNRKAQGLDVLKRELALLQSGKATKEQIFAKEQEVRKAEADNIRQRGVSIKMWIEDAKQKKLSKEEIEKLTIEGLQLEKEYKDKRNELIAAETEFEKEQLQKRREIRRKDREAQLRDAEKALQDEMFYINQRLENEDTVYVIRLRLLQQYHSRELMMLENQRDQKLAAGNHTINEEMEIRNEYNRAVERSLHDHRRKEKEIITKYNTELLAENEDFLLKLAAQEAVITQQMLDNVKSIYSNIKKSNNAEENTELEKLKKQFDAGLLKVEEYEEKRQQIKDKYALRDLNNRKTELEAMISNLQAKKVLTEEEKNTITSLQTELYAVLDDIREKDLDSHKKAGEKKNKLDQERIEKIKAYAQAAIQITSDIANTLFEIDAANRQAQLDRELKALEERKAKELDNKNLTEQQKEDIDKRYKDRENRMKEKAWKAEQEAKKQQAIINGALAITNILATMPKFDFGVASAIAIASAIASTALQVGKINSAKFPGLYRGTKDAREGVYRVGELGPELMWHKDSGFQMLGKRGEELQFIPQGAQVYTAFETSKMLSIQPPQFQLPQMTALPEWAEMQMRSTPQSLEIDYEKLGRSLARHIPEPTYVHQEFNSTGMEQWVVKAGNRTKIQNNRYRMNS